MPKKVTKKIQKLKYPRAASSRKSLGKVGQAKQKIAQNLARINRVVNRLEGEVEGLFKKIVKKGERSSREIRKSFDDLFSWVASGDFVSLASEKREDVEREVRRLAEDIVRSVKDIELIPGRADISGIFLKIRKNVSNISEQFTDNDIVQRAVHTLAQGKKEIFGVLSIPTQDEVVKLERKIVSLEKRLTTLSRKAA